MNDFSRTDMKNKTWLIPILIVAINALVIMLKWRGLSELLLAHFDLQGNAGGTMARGVLLIYPLIGAAVCGVAYLIGRWKQKLQLGMVILSSGISLVLLSSSMVTLTAGTMPVFMLAEPIILLIAIIAATWCVVKQKTININP